ncbi:MAG: Zn-ribbon domain-containing OB-fold protein [Firmicutes bacterium]|nr:Zn-ribbon domain-containing OB-fold protein [Bacillota bacterium]
MSGSEVNIIYNGHIKMPYNWSVGETGSRFFAELRDNQKIWGTRCPDCGTVFLPPRKNCPVCMVQIKEWVEIEPKGTLETYTAVSYDSPVMPKVEGPLIYGIVKLDGADTGLVHLLGEINPDDIRIGMRVEAVFKPETSGNILDIAYFKPSR